MDFLSGHASYASLSALPVSDNEREVTLIVTCPLCLQGPYHMRNATMDMDTSVMVLGSDLTGYDWYADVILYDENGDINICFSYEADVIRIKTGD